MRLIHWLSGEFAELSAIINVNSYWEFALALADWLETRRHHSEYTFRQALKYVAPCW